MALREDFPPKGSDYLGGESDGWEYKTTFSGTSLEHTYDMVRQFLVEEGYDNVPIPKNAKALSLFRISTRNKQILLFEDNGYVHNPIKILFPLDGRKKKTITLHLYNEANEHHLLKFHRVFKEDKEE